MRICKTEDISKLGFYELKIFYDTIVIVSLSKWFRSVPCVQRFVASSLDSMRFYLPGIKNEWYVYQEQQEGHPLSKLLNPSYLTVMGYSYMEVSNSVGSFHRPCC